MKQKKFFYISPRDVRKNRSDSVANMYACQEFSQFGLDVTLVAPKVSREEYSFSLNDIEMLYGFKPLFKVYELKTKIHEGTNQESKASQVIFAKFFGHFLFILNNLGKFRDYQNIIWSRCFISTVPYILLKKMFIIRSVIVFSNITPRKKMLHRFVFRNVDKIITSIPYAREDIIRLSGVGQSKIFLIKGHVQNFNRFISPIAKNIGRQELNLKPNKHYILYAGKAGGNTLQVDYFIEAARKLLMYEFIIVGANKFANIKYKQIIKKKNISNLTVYPFLPLPEYIRFVNAADVLVAYYSSTDHNSKHLKPGKMGVYLSSGNPCIFSDLMSLRSLFPDNTVFYAAPDNPQELVNTIKYVIENPQISSVYTKNAIDFAREGSKSGKLKEIMDFVSSSIK